MELCNLPNGIFLNIGPSQVTILFVYTREAYTL